MPPPQQSVSQRESLAIKRAARRETGRFPKEFERLNALPHILPTEAILDPNSNQSKTLKPMTQEPIGPQEPATGAGQNQKRPVAMADSLPPLGIATFKEIHGYGAAPILACPPAPSDYAKCRKSTSRCP